MNTEYRLKCTLEKVCFGEYLSIEKSLQKVRPEFCGILSVLL